MRNSSPPNLPPGQVPGDEDPEKIIRLTKSGILKEGVQKAMSRLCKWKSILAFWQLGTREQDDGEFRAVADLREQGLVHSVENRAIIGALLAKKIITQAEWCNALIMEAQALEKYMEKRFPGYRANDSGMEIAPDVAAETRKKFNFPP